MIYRVKITAIEDGKKEEVFKEDLTSVALLGSCAKERDKDVELVMKDSVAGLAAKIDGAEMFSKAANLYCSVNAMKHLKDLMAEHMEDELSDSIGGAQ